jgi:hypothetical protein
VAEEKKSELVEGEDFYREGPYIVFTEKFLKKRGYCCESGCRHCPYGFMRQAPGVGPQEGGDTDA